MAEGKEMLTFPGPGGYKIEWSPGAIHFKLEKAPSGHLVMPCDAFDRVRPTRGGVQGDQLMLHTAEPGSSSNDARPAGPTPIAELAPVTEPPPGLPPTAPVPASDVDDRDGTSGRLAAVPEASGRLAAVSPEVTFNV